MLANRGSFCNLHGRLHRQVIWKWFVKKMISRRLIRSDSCLLHITDIIFPYADNRVWTWKFADSFMNQILGNAALGVDTYFFLSGLLVSYFYIKNKMDKDRIQPLTYKAKTNEFVFLVIRRFIRYVLCYLNNNKILK